MVDVNVLVKVFEKVFEVLGEFDLYVFIKDEVVNL